MPMIRGKKIIVVLPAYNAEKTLHSTIGDIPPGLVDEFILVDDKSTDQTVAVAKKLGLKVIEHQINLGYGGNQKTCYTHALNAGADIIVMLHPDYQYEPKLLSALVEMVASGIYDVALGSRILGNGALKGGMPGYKYISNRFLTFVQNILLGQKLSEYHTGYRAFAKKVLQTIDWRNNSNDFIFDNEILLQVHYHGFNIGEISCPTKYFPDASSISFKNSLKYGQGVLAASFKYRFHKWKLLKCPLFEKRK